MKFQFNNIIAGTKLQQKLKLKKSMCLPLKIDSTLDMKVAVHSKKYFDSNLLKSI